MTINEFLQKYRRHCEFYEKMCYTRPRVRCADGYTVSVQAGYGIYSIPRRDAESYTKVELGYPSRMDKSIIEYAATPGSPTNTIYAYVPVEEVDDLLKRHGGIVGIDSSNCHEGVWEDD